MKLAEIEERLAQVDITAAADLIYELLAAYGTPQASITKLRSGNYNKSDDPSVVLWRRKVWDRYQADADEAELILLVDRAQADTSVSKLKPRFIIAHSEQRLVAVDTRIGQTLDIELGELTRHAAFFMPWAGAEKVRSETISYVDTKVAQQMAKLYDEIVATNPDLPTSDEGRRDLNVFFSRLLFCFFAEDTGVFADGIFTDGINQLTVTDGSDTADFLDELFVILDTPQDERDKIGAHFEQFGYVNGSLFADRIAAPQFSRKARNIVVDCGTLDWSSINPDIFGSMIQAVTAGEDRSALGMHYTSVENILKVLNPLFLDELEERYDDAQDSVRKLKELHEHLGEIKVFDPACGSGNFLIVAYKRLRGLEHRILQRLVDLDGGEAPLFADSKISLENFYGIEIDDFAHDIAKLSLWFAKHQMNQEYDDLFGIERPLIPLREAGTVVCANATRIDWHSVCAESDSVFVCGNPPYVGSSMQTDEQKADMAEYFGTPKYPRNMDYVGIWFLKAADWLGPRSRVGFVATNSICQGTHLEMLWTPLLERGAVIVFAHTSFLWSNEAKGGAGVTCVVVGISRTKYPAGALPLADAASVRKVANINPYLVASDDDTVVHRMSSPPPGWPAMKYGSKPSDGGHLVLSAEDRKELLEAEPSAAHFIREYVGAKELTEARRRYCLWIEDEHRNEAMRIGTINTRAERVAAFRLASDAASTRDWADRPHRFKQVGYEDSPCIAVPRHSSERRQYIPMGLYPQGTVISDANFAIYNASPMHFALLNSRMHMAWVRAVAGRIKSDIRYANTLCYNTFPVAPMSDQQHSALHEWGLAILAARERWPDRSLSELYDPNLMPANLSEAHRGNDQAVDQLYRSKPFQSDSDRMELLLRMYRDLVAEAEAKKSKKVDPCRI